MSLQNRLTNLRRAVGGLPPPGQLVMLIAFGVGSRMAEERPPVVYFNVDRRVATVVFAGPEPDPTILGPLEARLAPWGLAVVAGPGDIPPPDAPD